MILSLPFPISVNAIWRGSGRRVYRSPKYEAWIAEAHVMYLQQRRECGKKISGPFHAHIALDQRRKLTKTGDRKTIDADNYIKAVLDFCAKTAKVIDGDHWQESTTVAWAPVDGCVVTIRKAI